MQVKVQTTDGKLIVTRARPAKGKGPTLAEFSDFDGRGRERVAAFLAERRHTVTEQAAGRPRRTVVAAQAEMAMA